MQSESGARELRKMGMLALTLQSSSIYKSTILCMKFSPPDIMLILINFTENSSIFRRALLTLQDCNDRHSISCHQKLIRVKINQDPARTCSQQHGRCNNHPESLNSSPFPASRSPPPDISCGALLESDVTFYSCEWKIIFHCAEARNELSLTAH